MLHHVAQLPHVALPVVFLHALDNLRRHGFVLVVFVVEPVEKKQAQGQNVLPALAQGRDGDGNHVEPVVKILPKGAVPHHFGQIPVGGGNKAHVDALGPHAPHTGHLLRLQHPQKLYLKGERNFSNLVQKHGAAVRRLQKSDLSGAGSAGKRALFIAEQLAFQQVFRNGPAVDRHQRMVPAHTAGVNLLGHLLLARAGLSQNQHGGVKPAHPLRQRKDLLRLLADGHHLFPLRVGGA
ncbi:hypothetical protein SDC9_86543 [bioreactor metagenome]|uniref:Uncharacterized protein n=1 Tax=bioreactor metagenome TaxID=1076179 RepID=A0A644ZGR2_9ZZZZ